MNRAPRVLLAATLVLGGLPARGEPTVEMAPLVVTARRGSVLPAHFAGHATVIEEAEVVRSGARSLADLLESRGGLSVTSATGDNARGTVRLRGFGEGAASRTLVLVDGRPLNRPDMTGASLQEIPLARVARVEILRGAHTARFGDQAVGGVINIVTREATAEPALTLEAAAGSDGWRMARLNHSLTRAGHRFEFDAEASRSDGWRDNAHTENTSLGGRWSKKVAPGMALTTGFFRSEQSGRFPGPLTTAQYLTNPRQSIYSGPFAEQYGSRQNTTRMELEATLEPGDWGALELPLTLQRRDLSWNMGPGYHADNLLDTLTCAPVLRRSGDGWNATAGLDLRCDRMEVTNYREYARRNATGSAELERASCAAFAYGEWEPLPDWQLSGAVRAAWSGLDARARNVRRPNDPNLNFARTLDETNTAMQLGLRWEPVGETTAWLRYDRLYRLPAIDEIASYQGFLLSQPFNDQLHAETGHNLELGAEWIHGPWHCRANGFAQWLNGEIAYDFVRNLNTNLADTRRLGGEIEAGYQTTHWSASVRYAGVDATYADGPNAGRDIYLVPNHQLSTLLELRPHRTLGIQLEHRWQSACYEGNDSTNTQPRLPAFDTLNLMLTYEPSPNWMCYLRVSNLLDERYATIKYSGLWYPAAGRQFQLGLRHVF